MRSSFWFLPILMACAAVGLALATTALDRGDTLRALRVDGWLFTGGAEGASTVLGTIAGSMITIVGIVFSMTLVTLSLASSQFGPRLLRNFMRDTTYQLVLGIFVATFLYCLLVLRTIRHAEGAEAFVPHLSVTLGVLLAVFSLGVLIYFIHHVSVAIQANEIIARLSHELCAGIEQLFPEPAGTPAPKSAEPAAENGVPVPAQHSGYLQFIDLEALLALARQHDLVLRLACRPGEHLITGQPLLWAQPPSADAASLTDAVNAAFVLGNQRTAGQDLLFVVNQLVEIAVRALSPGINDPFTAMACLDRLGIGLVQVAGRQPPAPQRLDSDGTLRLIAPPLTFCALADAAFDPIREYGCSSVAVSLKLLDTLAVVAPALRSPQQRDCLARHGRRVARRAGECLNDEEDRQQVARRCDDLLRLLARVSGPA
ncbi:hypothetical protein SF06_07730 [Pseudomonas flexibilis]|uniref:Uncharacterized membrane protein n=2 Tax=Pseudomonas flexibilis TaxID=706570 RepID=A0A1N6YDP5_9PSED|nr:hypothetical protein SF06_07730 [Pseudomonas flexibilis]SIR12708.1 Uncharacterized membrane protein [Pseudomonas flexibilis]